MSILPECRIPFNTGFGGIDATIILTPGQPGETLETAPLIEIDSNLAAENGETVVQLREGCFYEYEIEPAIANRDLRLRCSLAKRRTNLRTDSPDAGRIETGSYCGTLLLELVEGEVSPAKDAVSSVLLTVRSMKLDYRTEYRGMLRRLGDELAGLVADARSSAKTTFRSTFQDRRDSGWLQINCELLRELVDSVDFHAALRQITSYPHEQLAHSIESMPSDRPMKWSPNSIKQAINRNPKRSLPAEHSLRLATGMAVIAERVDVHRKIRDVDTPENRFIKFALRDFCSFLSDADAVFSSSLGWLEAAVSARRVMSQIVAWLDHSLFREISDLRLVPLGSPVLQRKAGYREALRAWLRFRTAAEISWDGGDDVFHAGQRDVATLYEYWLFFELLGWFFRKCVTGETRPPVEQLVEGLSKGSPTLTLRRGRPLAPFKGEIEANGRKLNARFAYNRTFKATKSRTSPGSWTRSLHPDYTFTFWPSGFHEFEAEELELLIHIHFDAKYRVENVEALFGVDVDEDVDSDAEGNYKRQDLLKMHAYRDAIRRSQGAYIIYPGRDRKSTTFRGFHEILPGLGAFCITPSETGTAQGMDRLDAFLDEVLLHLTNRTTALERSSFHLRESYSVKDAPVDYGSLSLPEADPWDLNQRPLPPAEEIVLVAWYRNSQQRDLAFDSKGLTFVRLGNRTGALHVHPNLSRVRRVLLRSDNLVVARGLLQLREPGFRILTRSQLRARIRRLGGSKQVADWMAVLSDEDDEYIYAVFQTRPDEEFSGQEWNGEKVMDLIETFESNRLNHLVVNVGRTSPYPRLLPLRDLLKSIKGIQVQ